jgi:hypothetical protein
VAKLQERGLGAVPAVRKTKGDLRLETRPAPVVLVSSAGVNTGALLHLGKKKGTPGGGGTQLEKGEKERKGVFFNAPSPRAPLPSAPTTADARQTQKRPQRGDCSILQKNKPGSCFGEEEGALLRIFSKKKDQSRRSQIFH